jgi:hypothetical protein
MIRSSTFLITDPSGNRRWAACAVAAHDTERFTHVSRRSVKDVWRCE